MKPQIHGGRAPSSRWAPFAARSVGLLAAAATLARPAAAQLALAASCNVQTAQLSDSWLGVYCNNLNTASFGYNWTWIDLDWCVANNGGELVGGKNGHFHHTCTRCHAALTRLPASPPAAGRSGAGAYATGYTLDLSCACLDGHGHEAAVSTLDLNTVLVDVDGALGCFGRLGNKTLSGPPSKA